MHNLTEEEIKYLRDCVLSSTLLGHEVAMGSNVLRKLDKALTIPVVVTEPVNKVESFKREFKDLLTRYNVEIFADSIGEGFTSEVVVDMDNKEIMRVVDTISQGDIK